MTRRQSLLLFGLVCILACALQCSLVAADDEERTPEENKECQQKRWGTPGYGAPRKPGKLLLNMLIKNERDHLDRTLPKWTKVIDYWIIGVDDANSDDSVEVIHKHLGHIPGHIVIVHFDGMGPTWSVLVQHGVDHFPEATHGIVVDADMAPMKDHLDRMQLDIRCSKHMYTIWTEDHRNERKMDWIYANRQGAKISRRTHQTIESPELPCQEVFQTLIDLPVDEREGGYQDRTPGKNKRYIQFLLDDLKDFPGDTRTMYYLGYAHYDNFKKMWDAAGGNPGQDAWDELERGMKYMKDRIELKGNKEEKWFTILKLGEINERYLRDWPEAEKWYQWCADDDPDRADPHFYIGQHYRLAGNFRKAYEPLRKAATLPIPDRSLFQWHYLYWCLAKLEFGRSVTSMTDATLGELKDARSVLRSAKCQDGDPGNERELGNLLASVALMIDEKQASGGSTAGGKARLKAVKKLLKLVNSNFDDLDEELRDVDVPGEFKSNGKPATLFTLLLRAIVPLNDFAKNYGKKPEKSTCRAYRQATTPYLRFYKKYVDQVSTALEDPAFMRKWEKVTTRTRAVCR